MRGNGIWPALGAAVALSVGLACSGGSAPGRPAMENPSPVAASAAAPTAAAAPTTGRAAGEPVKLKVGHNPAVPYAGIYLALARGYFAEEGFDVQLEEFTSGEQQIPAIATDQVSASGLGMSAGIFGAVARGVDLKIVAGVSYNEPGYSSSALVVRKDLLDSGAIRGLADLRGRTVAVIAQSTSNAVALSRGIHDAGLTDADVNVVVMSFPDQLPALANGAIDAATPSEPFVARAVQQGIGVRWKGMDELYPMQMLTTIGYSPAFARERPAEAQRFMVAYLRGARDFVDAVKHGRDRPGVYQVLAEYTPIKDLALYDQMTPSGIEPDGAVNLESMEFDQEWYLARGHIREKVDLAKVVDQSFREAALQRLGRYQPRP